MYITWNIQVIRLLPVFDYHPDQSHESFINISSTVFARVLLTVYNKAQA